MAATDKFLKVGTEGTLTYLTASKPIGATSITVNSTANWPTDTGVSFAIRKVSTVNGVQKTDPGTYTSWRGQVSGNTITGLVLVSGTDQEYGTGEEYQVFIPVTAEQHNSMVDGILVSHEQSGVLKANTVGESQLKSNSVGTDQLKNGSVTTDTLAESAKPQFKVGIIPSATLGSTGNKSITGVGFRPKLVRFTLMPTYSNSAINQAHGSMTDSDQFTASIAISGSNMARSSTTNAAIWYLASNGTVSLRCERVSLDDDGFTLNVVTSSNSFDVSYEAYG